MTVFSNVDPLNDIGRLTDISVIDIESPEVRSILDAYSRRAAELLHLPVGMVSIVLPHAQYLAGRYGLDGSWMAEADGTPVEWSFCLDVVRGGTSYVIEDATADARHFDNPLVVNDGARSYAGAPVRSSS